MTQARTLANGVGSPSLLDQWIDAMLRVFVELVLHAARLFASKQKNPPAACDGDQVQTLKANDVPGQLKENSPATPQGGFRRLQQQQQQQQQQACNNSRRCRSRSCGRWSQPIRTVRPSSHVCVSSSARSA